MKRILLLLLLSVSIFAGSKDPITGLPGSIDAKTYEINAANVFRADAYFDADSGCVLITTDAVKFIHLIASVSSQDSGFFEIREAVTTSAPGDTLTAMNAKRTSSDTLMTMITETPTVTDYGTSIAKDVVGADGESSVNKWILKQSTKYLIRFVPNSSAKFTLNLEIYEATGNRDD